jgi:hypothetical protein
VIKVKMMDGNNEKEWKKEKGTGLGQDDGVGGKFSTPTFGKRMDHPHEKGEYYRQNHPDRTNLRILNFADNKDLHGGELSDSLISVPGHRWDST